MTFCVAAVCEHQGKNAIVCCCDMQATLGGDYVKAQDSYKLSYFGWGTILKAGGGSDADELIALIQPVLDAYNAAPKPYPEFDIRISALLANLRAVVRKRKSALVEHFLGLNYNISASEWRENGGKWFPPEKYESISYEIKALRLGCELICVYADDGEPIIIEITNGGDVLWQDHYACIGSGSAIGLAILAQSSWHNTPPLMDCLARVYLAKLTAESDPYVGPFTLFDFCIEGGEEDDLSREGKEYLSSKVERIAAPSGLEFKPSFLATTHSNIQGRPKQEEPDAEKPGIDAAAKEAGE